MRIKNLRVLSLCAVFALQGCGVTNHNVRQKNPYDLIQKFTDKTNVFDKQKRERRGHVRQLSLATKMEVREPKTMVTIALPYIDGNGNFRKSQKVKTVFSEVAFLEAKKKENRK